MITVNLQFPSSLCFFRILDGTSTWHRLGYFYMNALEEKVKNAYLTNIPTMYTDEIKKIYGVREEDMLNANSLDKVQLAYVCKINRQSLYESYEQASAKNYMNNITTPLIAIHSSDDPYLNQLHIQHYFKTFMSKYIFNNAVSFSFKSIFHKLLF